MTRKIALVLGSGDYAKYLYNELFLANKVTTFISLDNKKESDFGDAHLYLENLKLAELFGLLAAHGISHIVFGGQFKPKINDLIRVFFNPDEVTKKLLSQQASGLINRKAVSFFNSVSLELQSIGVRIMSAAELLPALVLNEIDYLKLSADIPNASSLQALALSAQEIIDQSDRKYIQQIIAFDDNEMILIEHKKGTNHFLRKLAKIPKGEATRSVFKLCPSTFDYRFDIPVIGKRTMELASNAEVDNFIIDEAKGIVYEKKELIDYCEQNNIHLLGLSYLSK